MRLPAAFFVALLLSSCGPAPPPQAAAPRDETKALVRPGRSTTVDPGRRSGSFYGKRWQGGRSVGAYSERRAAGEPPALRPQPLAMEDASDLDDLYGRMLLSNRNYGWAMLFFQKNQARWKNWKPQTPDTAARLESAIPNRRMRPPPLRAISVHKSQKNVSLKQREFLTHPSASESNFTVHTVGVTGSLTSEYTRSGAGWHPARRLAIGATRCKRSLPKRVFRLGLQRPPPLQPTCHSPAEHSPDRPRRPAGQHIGGPMHTQIHPGSDQPGN